MRFMFALLLMLCDVTYAAKCFECTWADQEMTTERLDFKRVEKEKLEQKPETIRWMLFNDPYLGTEKIASYPTNEELHEQCRKCDTTNPSRVCVRWHYFTDTSNPKGPLNLNSLYHTLSANYSEHISCKLRSLLHLSVINEVSFIANTLNVTWGCVRSNQLGCWREHVDELITKEVCLCEKDFCNSFVIHKSSAVVILLCALIATVAQKCSIM